MEKSGKRQGLLLKARGIGVRRGGTQILQGVDFVARPGQLVGILGPSGSGKTTLLYALSGFRSPNDGVVTMAGRDVAAEFASLKHRIGFVPQDDIVPTSLRVERVVHYAARLRLPEASAERQQARTESLLARLGLGDRRRVRVRSLSGGQRKRVSIAVELVGEPDILFADEPTSGLDPALEASLTGLLRKMADEGRSIVTTTHILSSLDRYDRLAVVAAGRLVYFGPPADIKEFFGVKDLTAIYNQLGADAVAGWQRRLSASGLKQKYLS